MTDIVERLRNSYVSHGLNYVQEAADELESLRTQLAKCQKERDLLIDLVTNDKDLTAAQARIAELVEALKQYTNACSSVNNPNDWTPKVKDEGHYARKALSREYSMEALNEYRDRVLEDAALICDSHADDPVYCGEAIRALKKEEV